MSTRDLTTEVLAGIGTRPARTALTILGTVRGIGTLVTTLGVSATAGNQIAGRFDSVTATEIAVDVNPPPTADTPPTVRLTARHDLPRRYGGAAGVAHT